MDDALRRERRPSTGLERRFGPCRARRQTVRWRRRWGQRLRPVQLRPVDVCMGDAADVRGEGARPPRNGVSGGRKPVCFRGKGPRRYVITRLWPILCHVVLQHRVIGRQQVPARFQEMGVHGIFPLGPDEPHAQPDSVGEWQMKRRTSFSSTTWARGDFTAQIPCCALTDSDLGRKKKED